MRRNKTREWEIKTSYSDLHADSKHFSITGQRLGKMFEKKNAKRFKTSEF